MNKTKIAFFIPSLGGGGAEIVTINLANQLSAMGYDTSLIVATDSGIYWSRIDARVNLVRLRAKRSLVSVLRYYKAVVRIQPALLLSNMVVGNIIACAIKFVSRKPGKLVIREPNVSIRHDSYSLKSTVISGLKWLLYRFADAIIANSEDTLISLSSTVKTPRMKYVIGNPVLPEHKIERVSHDSEHNWSTSACPFVVAIGRLTDQKGFDVLIDAIEKYTRRIGPIACHILGEGANRNTLESQISSLGLDDYVRLVGFVEKPMSVLNRGDLFVLSSRWEGFGNVLVEALASGIRVVSTNCPGGPREILCNGRYGRLCHVNDPEDLYNAIANELNSETSSRDSRISRARQFSVEKIAARYIEVFHDTLTN